MNRIRNVIYAGVIAAIYACLTIAFAPISYGPVQARISEALFVLPCFTDAAVPGLFLGCLLSSMLTGAPVYDVIFGSAATLLASVLTRVLAKRSVSKWLLPLPTVFCNAIIVGLILKVFYAETLPLSLLMLYVALGEALICYLLGLPLRALLARYADRLFKKEDE